MSVRRDPAWPAALIEEILGTPAFVRAFDPAPGAEIAAAVVRKGGLAIVGEGSSRIFPGRRAIFRAHWGAVGLPVLACGCREAAESPLVRQGLAVLALSRSGRTQELLDLVRSLESSGHDAVFRAGAMEERGMAATCSVVGEALLVDAVFEAPPLGQDRAVTGHLDELADRIEEALTGEMPGGAIDALAAAETIWFCGRDDGVAEELALKCCEIARRRSVFVEGTRLLHGMRTVVRPHDAIVVVEPFGQDVARFATLAGQLGARVVAIASERIPPFTAAGSYRPSAGMSQYVQLAIGWNLIVELGGALGTDLDGRDVRV